MSHFYLGSYVGTGTGLDPFRPRGSDQPGASAIDLRPDGSLVTGRCLVAVPIRDDTIGEYLGDDPVRAIPAPIKRRLESALGITLTASVIRDAIAEILMVHGRTDGTRWKPLRPSRLRNRYEIWLGGLLWSQPVIAGGASLSENWDCADSASLTCQLTWIEHAGDGSWTITTNRARLAGIVGDERAKAESDLATDDHEAQVTLATFTRVGGIIAVGPMCRNQSNTEDIGYEWRARDDDGTAGGRYHDMIRRGSGAGTTQIGTAADDPVVGEVLKVSADGSTIKGYIDGVEKLSVTDVNITGLLRCGITGYSDTNAGNLLELDTWSAADLAAPAAVPRLRNLLGVGT